jgi:hypothetical protein
MMTLSLPSEDRYVTSYLFEFAAGGPVMADAWQVFQAEPDREVTGSKSFGEQTNITLHTHTIPETGKEARQLQLGFRLDRVIAGVAIVDFTGRTPLIGQIETLASALLPKVEAGLAGATPNLGHRLLTMEIVSPAGTNDGYLRVAGETFPYFNDTPEMTADRAAVFGDATDIYLTQQRIPLGTDSRADDTFYQTHLVRFADEASASAWLRDVPDLIEASVLYDQVETVEAPDFGDETIAVTYRWRDQPTLGADVLAHRVFVRVGSLVASVRLEAAAGVPPAAVEELAAAQTECLIAGACEERAPVPSALGGDFLPVADANFGPAASGSTGAPGLVPVGLDDAPFTGA